MLGVCNNSLYLPADLHLAAWSRLLSCSFIASVCNDMDGQNCWNSCNFTGIISYLRQSGGLQPQHDLAQTFLIAA